MGLRTGYLLGAGGAALALLAAIVGSYPLLCLGVLGAGAGNASNLATRYAASDLARPEQRARTVGTIVWASTIGSTIGSVVSLYAGETGETFGLPAFGGSYLLAGLMFLLAALIVEVRLRPDPLAVAGGLGAGGHSGVEVEGGRRPSAGEALQLTWDNPAARLAVAAMIVVQVSMVGVMALTPLHMKEGGNADIVGLMMAVHIWGMYLFSPLVGRLCDKVGRFPMLYVAGRLCTWGAVWAAVTPAAGVVGVFAGNFQIGLGWCFGVVAASSLIVEQFPLHQRVAVQGVGDLAKIGSGAFAGVSSGALYPLFGYGGINAGNAAFGLLLVAATALTYAAVRRRPLPTPA